MPTGATTTVPRSSCQWLRSNRSGPILRNSEVVIGEEVVGTALAARHA
jgi:hypothetical protein